MRVMYACGFPGEGDMALDTEQLGHFLVVLATSSIVSGSQILSVSALKFLGSRW